MKHIFTNSNESAVVRNGYRCAKVARPLRTVFLIGTLLLTLGVGQMRAGSVSGGEIYFDATQSGWGSSLSSVEYIISHDSYSCWYAMTKISNTNLYYISSGSWGDSKYFAFTGNYGWTSCEGNSYDSRKGYGPSGSKRTAKSTYGVNSGSTYLFYASSSSNDASISTSSPAGYLGAGKTYTALNYTQTLNQTLSTDGGSTFSASTASIATVTVSSYELNGASSSKSSSGTISSGYSSTSCAAARTATVTYSVASVATGYEFVGWYDGSTQKSTSTTYTYNAIEAKTITARFKETQYSLTFSHNGHGSIAVAGNTVSSGSTANVNYFTTMTLVATANTNYHFAGWTKSGSNTSAVTIGDESADGTSTTIKATNTGATITAVFEADASNYTLTFGAGSNGSVSAKNTSTEAALTSGSEYSSGTGVTVTATPNSHYHLEGWYSNSELTTPFAGAGTTNPYSFSLTSNISIYAKFALNQCAITLDRNGGTAGDESVTATYGSTLPSFTAHTRSGYTLNGYFTATSGGTKIINADGTLVASTSYADGSGNWSSDASTVTLHAQWTEKMTTVTVSVSPENSGTLTVGGADFTPGNTTTAGVTTSRAVVATAQPGYKFSSWGTSGNATGTSSTNTYTLKGNGNADEGTLTANFSRLYAYVEGRFQVKNKSRGTTTTTYASGGQWNETSTNIQMEYDNTNHRFALHTHMTPSELTANHGTGCDDCKPYFYIKTSTSNNSLANVTSYMCTSAQTLTTAGSANGKTVSSSSGSNSNLRFNSTTTSGYAVVYFDQSKIWYELEQRLQYNGNGKTGGSAPSGTYGNNTYHATNSSITVPSNSWTKTGYHFIGWKVANAGYLITAGSSVTMNANKTLYAQWEANSYTVTLNVDEAHKGNIASATTSHTVYYNTVTTNIPSLPTAEDYYGLEGYYTEQNGAGTKLINGDGSFIASVEGYTDADKKWIRTDGVALYAYYKEADLTGITLSASTVAPNTAITATPIFGPAPDGTTSVCWKLLRNNGNLYPGITFSPNPSVGNASVSFNAPSASGSYKVAAVLRTGSVCGSGTVLDSIVEDLVVAGEHTVTIRYQDGDGRTLSASGSVTGRPLAWSSAIAPATIIGYTFDHWVAGDGVTLSEDGTNALVDGEDNPLHQSSANPIYIKATYDGTLTAVYTKKRMIYFYNTLNWESVYVYFYKNDSYWESTGSNRGSGASTTSTWTNTPYSEGKHGQMLPMSEGSKIYYFDAEDAGVNASYDDVVFTEANQHSYEFFYETKAVRRGDYKTSLPMFVPLTEKSETKNKTDYYNNGYWMNYPDNTGYTLKIYSSQGATTPTRTIRFPFSEDTKMPLKLDVEFNSPGTDFFYTIYREDGQVLSADYGMNQNYHSNVQLNDASKKIKITTTATGIYKYSLVYMDNSGTKDYYISVDYPIGQDDYRVWYSDNATWSQSSAHSAGWYHPSDVIRKNTDAEVTQYDTVSFFVSKGAGITATMKFQYASAIAEAGAITWSDVASGGITLSNFSSVITKAGVYNFIIKQVGTANPVVEKVEPYSGNYYIRTDNAGSTKWDYYRAADHQMTYSEFSKNRSTNTFGELYTHYYMQWCPRSTNIKFCVANDYSSCITDTLENDLVDLGNMISAGWLNSDGESQEYRDKFSANIRFMYNDSTNKISRAYLSSSTNKDRKFLVLRSNTAFTNSDGSALSGAGETSTTGTYEAIFQDNEDWIYEREVKLTPGQLFKIYASYAQATVQEQGSQHFRGEYADNAWTENTTAVELIGGTGSACKARIIYDFKTNRLMAAYLPDNTDITGTLAINADIMVIREHQDAGQQIKFTTNDSKLTNVKTVYGVMRFNRWILNNRQHPEDHVKEHGDTDAHIAEYHPLVDAGSMKSIYERALYWVSFPFDVNLSEVFGFGTYGTHWIMMDYNGADRARIGYWKDNEDGFWEYIWDRRGVTLKAGRGYVLALELDLMQANDKTFWSNDIQQVELFFPSTSSTTGTIKQTAVDVTVDPHLCTIDRRTQAQKDANINDWNNDRRVADSHWNIIGVPSYANYGSELTDGSSTITWHANPKENGLPFLYEWNSNDNTYTVQSGTTYSFKAMHAYYVQYAGTLHWTLASATPSSIVARRTYAEEPENIEFRLELQQNEKMIDQTFVKLSDDENVKAEFQFDEDLNKEFNGNKANVYTFVEDYIPTAGNTLPMSDQTTIIPMGVRIKTAGEYTFAIPEGTEGVGVTLIDNETGARTSLSTLDYTVDLTAGTYDGRFVLEISPVAQTPTGIEEVTGDELQVTGARKVMVDGILYIVKDGKVFDARGARCK